MKILKRGRTAADPVRRLLTEADRARDTGRSGVAAKAYAQVLELAPERAPIWVQYAHMLKDIGRSDEAIAAYRRAGEIDPADPDPWLHLAHLLKNLHRYEEAADAFLRTVELDPAQPSAVAELTTLAGRGIAMDEARLTKVLPRLRRPSVTPRAADSLGGLRSRLDSLLARSRTAGSAEAQALIQTLAAGVDAAERLEAMEAQSAGAAAHVVFDVSDLLSYFGAARLPTGIQRVQIEVITALLKEPTPGLEIRICAFTSGRDVWSEVPEAVFLSLAELSLISGEVNDPVWQDALDDLKLTLAMSPALAFPRGAYLVNLGTSWWLQNYFLHVRRARAVYGVRYIPFVHDLIPIMTPEHCIVRLTQDFISWASGVFAHADRYLTNSEASKRDFLTVARTLNANVDPDDVHVVRLDADFRKPTADAPMAESLARYGLTENGFVLFVSTIESRKNHLAAFTAWIELAATHGVDALPTLVCVGNRGWLNDAVFAKAASDPVLRAKVKMISGVSDPDLANLYRACRFTLYPSTYEGWGLPVTESLCYGKAALLSDSSSLPEAGGEHVVYFPVGDQKALVRELDRLMFDDAWRAEIEARARAFRPRPWRTLGLEIADQIRAWAAQDAAAGGEHVVYFPVGDQKALVRELERLMFDDAWRAEVEARARAFRPRPWRTLGLEIADQIRVWAAQDAAAGAAEAQPLAPAPAEGGRYYWMRRVIETRIAPGMTATEIFRIGDGWWQPDDWGVWTKAQGGTLAVTLPADLGPARLYLGLRGLQKTPLKYAVSIAGTIVETGALKADEDKWLSLVIGPDQAPGGVLRIDIKGDKVEDFSVATKGGDPRVACVGLTGFMVCAEGDAVARADMVDAITFDTLPDLADRYLTRA